MDISDSSLNANVDAMVATSLTEAMFAVGKTIQKVEIEDRPVAQKILSVGLECLFWGIHLQTVLGLFAPLGNVHAGGTDSAETQRAESMLVQQLGMFVGLENAWGQKKNKQTGLTMDEWQLRVAQPLIATIKYLVAEGVVTVVGKVIDEADQLSATESKDGTSDATAERGKMTDNGRSDNDGIDIEDRLDSEKSSSDDEEFDGGSMVSSEDDQADLPPPELTREESVKLKREDSAAKEEKRLAQEQQLQLLLDRKPRAQIRRTVPPLEGSLRFKLEAAGILMEGDRFDASLFGQKETRKISLSVHPEALRAAFVLPLWQFFDPGAKTAGKDSLERSLSRVQHFVAAPSSRLMAVPSRKISYLTTTANSGMWRLTD